MQKFGSEMWKVEGFVYNFEYKNDYNWFWKLNYTYTNFYFITQK